MEDNWYVKNRGIRPETLEAFGVTFKDDRASFRYPSGVRVRKLSGEARTFSWEAGSTGVSMLMAPITGGEAEAAFIVEGESDAMRLWQELEGKAYVFAMPGVTTWNDHWAADVRKYAKRVYVVLDNDQDYQVQAQVDGTWKRIKKEFGPRAKRVYLPPSTKDVCEFFELYDVSMFQKIVARSKKSRFTPLDLTKIAGPMPWLVPGLICKGDVTLMAGDPGLGKSWLTMALAVAIAEGHTHFLGRKLEINGPGIVLYVDEENPEDVVLRRMRQLGLTDKGAQNIRYLHRQGIWMDKVADDVLDEAMDLDPALIVFDSLSQIHQGDENSASSMSTLFKEGIIPLARETDAAVVIIHHSNKGESNNSFVRVRGSGGISASVDAAIDVRPTQVDNVFTVATYKSRRAQIRDVIPVSILDQPDGSVEVKAQQIKPAF